MIIKNTFFIIILVFVSCSNKVEQKKLPIAVEENWTVLNTKDSIPDLLNEVLKQLNHGKFEIANPNERFNATDVIIDSFPTKQLRLLSKKEADWRLTYIQGGFGAFRVYTQCKIKNDSIYDFKIAYSILDLNNNDSIDKYLLEKKLKLKEIKLKFE